MTWFWFATTVWFAGIAWHSLRRYQMAVDELAETVGVLRRAVELLDGEVLDG